MRLHSLVHNTQLRAQALDIVLNVRLQRFDVEAMLVQGVQDLFLERVPWSLSLGLRLLVIALESTDKLAKVLASQIGDSLERRRLKVLKASVIEDLAD